MSENIDVTAPLDPARLPQRLMQTHPRTVPRTFTATDPRARTRRCHVCGQRKDLTDFYRNRSDQMFGREHRCKACTAVKDRPAA